jgi:hypothetical protein
MKLNLLCGSMVLAAMFSVTANAQSCASPNTTWHPTPTNPGVPPINGDTCAAGTETGIVSLCGNNASAAQHAYVVKFTPQAAGTFTTITLSAVTGFTGYIGVVNAATVGACNGGGDTGACQTTGDAATPVQHALLTNGTQYFLIVSNSGADTAASCGTFTLTADGSLPVTLQNFTVS